MTENKTGQKLSAKLSKGVRSRT